MYITAKNFVRAYFFEKLNGYVSNSDHTEYAIKNFWHQYLPRNVAIELIKLFDVEQNGYGCDLEELGWELLLLQEKELTTIGSSFKTIRTKRQREDNSESVTQKGSSF